MEQGKNTMKHSQAEYKHKDLEMKRRALKAGGSVKTKHKIDAQLICREVRGKQ
ncbi:MULTISPECIES: hypothetical protein [unclassified Paenibacillus]|uniref:hypothetical protein n=1 Tax=unclassified Paenibacillus TaxID=185978 RepID=UPI002118E5E0|nr:MULTISPECIES: hypothetical protein [unclassified Paenibacillus]